MNIDSVFLFVFIFSCLFTLRFIINIILNIVTTPPRQVTYGNYTLLYLGLSLSYIITYLTNYTL